MTEGIGQIDEHGIQALNALIGNFVWRIQSPLTTTDLTVDEKFSPAHSGCGFVSVGNFTIAMFGNTLESDRVSAPYVNFSVNSIMTDLGELHELVVERSDAPREIPFESPETRIMSATSDVAVKIGIVQSIQIMEARALSGWIDKEGNSRKVDLTFDRAINFHGEHGSFSIMTEFGEIVNDMKIRSVPISPFDSVTVDDVTHSMALRVDLCS